jgi:hypothetical protein
VLFVVLLEALEQDVHHIGHSLWLTEEAMYFRIRFFGT